MHVRSADTIQELYYDAMLLLKEHGTQSAPRGQKTVEVLHVGLTLNKPQHRLLTQYRRNMNPFFHLAEGLWIMGGRADAAWITQYNGQLKQVLDDGHPDAFHAPYGERLRRHGRSAWSGMMFPPYDQLRGVYETLIADPESRRAVATLWNPAFDRHDVSTADRPCNFAVTFKLRERRLYMMVLNRSNDFVYGWSTTNVLQFTMLQEMLAAWLGVECGPYTHVADSLHLYVDDPFGMSVPPPERAGYTPLVQPFPLYRYVGHLLPRRIPVSRSDWDAAVQDMLDCPPDEWVDADAPPVGEGPLLRTIHYGLQAWHIWKRNCDLDLALRVVARMPYPDFRVECTRWLLRSAKFPTISLEPLLQTLYSGDPLAGLAVCNRVRAYVHHEASV